jgi:hypothetical protein
VYKHVCVLISSSPFFWGPNFAACGHTLAGFIIAVVVELWLNTQQSCLCTEIGGLGGWRGGVLDRETSLNPG